jgi:hypothetical protein
VNAAGCCRKRSTFDHGYKSPQGFQIKFHT